MQNNSHAHHYSSDCRRLAWFGYSAIAFTFGAFGLWAALAPLDSAAIAKGEVAVVSNRKLIQHLEGGIMREVLVKEAQQVDADQVLFRLQPVQAQANADTVRKQLDGVFAQIARLEAERDQRSVIDWPADLLGRRDNPDVASALASQEKQFLERKRSLEAQINVYVSRIQQTARDTDGKRSHEVSLARQLTSLQSEIAAVTPVADRGFYPRNKLNELQRNMWQVEGDLGVVRGDIARAQEVDEESRTQIEILRRKQIEDVTGQLADALGKQSDLTDKLTIASDVLSRVEVKAPRAGIVQAIKFNTIGEVVKPGDTLAELVTLEEGLIMTAQVQPSDVDAVHSGSKAEIRFPAFASRQRTAITGYVETIGSDVTVDPAGKQDSYYLARVVIDAATLPPALMGKLVPGMPASVFITTGERTMLTYLVGPLYERIVRTMRER
jgi:HlyD family secretion protein